VGIVTLSAVFKTPEKIHNTLNKNNKHSALGKAIETMGFIFCANMPEARHGYRFANVRRIDRDGRTDPRRLSLNGFADDFATTNRL